MLLVISGHPRSGTTLLQTLCDIHPQMAVTNEFATLVFRGDSYPAYCRHVYDRWRRVQNRWAFDYSYANELQDLKRHNFRFMLRHAWRMRRRWYGKITLADIEQIYRQTYPNATIVGDKWPHYLFWMDRFADEPDLLRLVIYRDCRDVTSSFLKEARSNWRDLAWVTKIDTADKIAARWVKAIEMMEKYAHQLYILRYENLVCQPEAELARLSDWLGIDVAGFPIEMIEQGSIGKYEKGLTAEEIDTINEVAGPTLARLGYV
jgi:hypothetical protein